MTCSMCGTIVSSEDMKLCNFFKFHIEGEGQFIQLPISSRLNSSSEFLNFVMKKPIMSFSHWFFYVVAALDEWRLDLHRHVLQNKVIDDMFWFRYAPTDRSKNSVMRSADCHPLKSRNAVSPQAVMIRWFENRPDFGCIKASWGFILERLPRSTW